MVEFVWRSKEKRNLALAVGWACSLLGLDETWCGNAGKVAGAEVIVMGCGFYCSGVGRGRGLSCLAIECIASDEGGKERHGFLTLGCGRSRRCRELQWSCLFSNLCRAVFGLLFTRRSLRCPDWFANFVSRIQFGGSMLCAREPVP